MPTRREVIDYITQSAQRYGIDPRVSLRVFQQESGLNPAARNITKKEESYGLGQLNVKGGMGVEARRQGIEPSDPSQWQKHVDLVHKTVQKDGWRQWYGARDVGIGRWQGVNSKGGTEVASRPPKNIDIGATPQLKELSPFEDKPKTTNWTLPLKQLAPTEQSNDMARHPNFDQAVKQAMAERGIQVAGFVPPGLTKGASEVRGAASKNVQPKGTIKDAEGAAKRSQEIKSVPDAEKQISGGKNLTPEQQREIAAWNKAHEDWLNGDGPNPGPAPMFKPNIKSATDPSGAVDPRTGTNIAPYDPNLAAQNDPNRQALIASKIRGYARQGGQPPQLPPPPGRQGDLVGPTAAAGAGAVVGGTMAGTQRPESKPTPNAAPGIPPSLEHLLIQGIPTIKEVMKDPQTAGAAKQVIQKVISTQAARDSAAADMKKDPTYYQRMASQRAPSGAPADPSDPMYERRMMDAVSRDSQRAMRGEADPALAMVQRQIQQGAPQQAPRPPRNVQQAVAKPVYPQPGPGQEKGDAPPPVATPYPTASQAGPSPHRFQQYAGVTTDQAVPPGFQAPAESMVNYPYNGVAPQMTPQMMDPTMMQLWQFFGGSGGNPE